MLAPNGVEEERGPRLRRVRDLRRRGRAAGAGRARRRGRATGWIEVSRDRDPRRLGRPLARLPQAAAGRRAALAAPLLGAAAGGRDRPRRRPRPGLRHRRPSDHPPLPRVPARAGGAGEAARAADRPRHRLRRPRDRRGEARLGSRSPATTTSRRRSRPRAANAAANGVELSFERMQPARIAAAAGADRRRQHDRADPEGRRRASSESRSRAPRRPLGPAPGSCPTELDEVGRRLRAARAARGRSPPRRRLGGAAAPSPLTAIWFPPMLFGDSRRPRLQDRAVPAHPRGRAGLRPDLRLRVLLLGRAAVPARGAGDPRRGPEGATSTWSTRA